MVTHLPQSLARQARVSPLLSIAKLAVGIPHDKKRDHNLEERGSGYSVKHCYPEASIYQYQFKIITMERRFLFFKKGKHHTCTSYMYKWQVMIYHI
jgi:hypothetical protein